MTLAYNYGMGSELGVLIASRVENQRAHYIAWRGDSDGMWRQDSGSIDFRLCRPHPEPDKIWVEFVAWRLTQ